MNKPACMRGNAKIVFMCDYMFVESKRNPAVSWWQGETRFLDLDTKHEREHVNEKYHILIKYSNASL